MVQAGEYIVNVITTLNDQSVSKTSSMFVIGTVAGSDSSNHTPVAVANADDTTPMHLATVTLDASSSSDSDGDALTFSWIQISGDSVILSSSIVEQPTFDTLQAGDTYVFQLTVTDPKGKSGTDTITITVN